MVKRARDQMSKTRQRLAPRLKKLVEALIPYGLDRIYLFGSWATGEDEGEPAGIDSLREASACSVSLHG